MKKLILVNKWHIIEPLGILHLAGIAKRRGWECRVVLVDEHDYEPLYGAVQSWQPDLVGFSIWTGWHVQSFAACDRIRAMGVPVVIGGPHATYFASSCRAHADAVVRGEGFRVFDRLLAGESLQQFELPGTPGVYFDNKRVAEGFPVPDRELVYETYSVLRESPIKSIMCTVGCPFKCSYCYAPVYNEMYNGFELTLRTIDDVIAEAREIRDRWGAKMIYFQDDIFGYRLEWLREFARRWPKEVGVPWHCQIRLELTQHAPGAERLDLFREGGCTGITLAIESGDAFLRQFVLRRPMSHELIVEGCRKIQARGLTLRTEQILAVPFSDIETDLSTLGLNAEINPEMAWTSILAPYGGTAMGTIASNFGFYARNNDDLSETFFDRSVLTHGDHARDAVEPLVYINMKDKLDNPLIARMRARRRGPTTADILVTDNGAARVVGEMRYLDPESNDRYCDGTVALQRVFNWLSRVPNGQKLGACYAALPKQEQDWKTLGELTARHLEAEGYSGEMPRWRETLAREMGCDTPDAFPDGVRDNPYYFCFFPSGPAFAAKLVRENHFTVQDAGSQFDELGRNARHWLFGRSLYRVDPAEPPIAAVAARHQRT